MEDQRIRPAVDTLRSVRDGDPLRPHKVVERAFLDLLSDVETQTGQPALFGSATAD